MLGWIALAAVGCSGQGQEKGQDAGPADVDLDPCGFAEPHVADIDVAERSDRFHAGVYSRIDALLRDGPEPSFHEVFLEEGACRYLKSAPGFCDPACTGGDACNVDAECVPYPSLVSGGTLTVTGVGDPIEIDPEDWSPGTYIGPGGLPATLFDEETVVEARLEGDVFPAIAVRASGVAPIDSELTASGFEMRGGADAEVTWTPGPDPEACVRVVLNGSNRSHGAPLSDLIECEGPDEGRLVVPQAMVEAFPIGATPKVTEGYDWPHSELTRYTRNTTSTDLGGATLFVHSTALFLLRHPE